MKKTTFVLTAITLALATALGMYLTRDRHDPVSPVSRAEEPATVQPDSTTGSPPGTASVDTKRLKTQPLPLSPASSALPAEVSPSKDPGTVIFDQAVRTLISPQTTFQEKQVAWGQIRSAGKFDQLISDLEQRFAARPDVPELPATLGQAYLHKAGSIQDIREQGILGMKADQTFDAALNLDSSNWEARFWKATAMSYWPPQLGKGKDVIEHCLELLKQQESAPPQEQFAQTYVLLGDQYQAQGQPEYASQAWKRGLGLFPSNPVLKGKLAGQQ